MRQVMLFLVAFLLFLGVSLQASASSSYIDEMTGIRQTEGNSYYNLEASLAPGNWTVPDREFLTLKNPKAGRGGAVYRVQGGRELYARIYTPRGTQIFQNSKGEYLLGSRHPADRMVEFSPRYSPSYDGVFFSDHQNTPYRLYSRASSAGELGQVEYFFQEVSVLPNDLIDYGVHISWSSDGIRYQPLGKKLVQRVSYQEGAIYGEEWMVSIPPVSGYAKVEINDLSQIPKNYGGMELLTPLTMTSLTQVEIRGDLVLIGLPAEIQKEKDLLRPGSSGGGSVVSKDGNKGTTSSKSSSRAVKTPVSTTSKGEVKTATVKTQTPAPTSKFQGTTSSTPKKTESKADVSKTAETKKASTFRGAEVPQQEVAPEPQRVYYTQGAAETTDPFDKGVTIYLLMVSGAILFLLLRPKSVEKEESDSWLDDL